MHYSFAVKVLPENDVYNPVEFSIKLATGILRRCQIFFARGCSTLVRCQLWSDAEQLAPQNPDGYYALDGDKVDAPLYYNLDLETNQLWFVAWSFHCSYSHTLQVHLDVQGRDEPDLYNLMQTLIDTEDRLIDLMRQVF
jgi:hypothetical protein